MASRGLGTLTLDLVAKTGAFTGPLDKAARDADRSFRRITDSASKFGKALGTGIGLAAVAATTALIGITKAAIDNADAIRDLSIRTGIGTETLSAYGYAASQTGTSIEALGKGLNIFAKNIVAALNPASAQAKIFESLGISVTDATGKIKDMEVILPEFATKFKNLEAGTTKTALVLKEFGRAGAELTEFLNLGGVGLEEYTDKARELGLVVDQETADAADKFKDTLGEVKATVSGLGLSIARELLPSLQEGAEDFKRLVQEGDLAHNMVTLLSAALSLGVGAIDAYGDAVKRTGAIMDFMTQAGLGWQETVRNIWAPWSDGTVANGIAKMKQAMAEGDKALADINNPKKNPFANVRGGSSTVDPNARATDSRALARALSNPRTPKGKSGKSEAEKEAERLEKALRRMADAERDWQVELNDNGNPIAKEYAGRLADITAQADKFKEDGIPTKEITAFVDKMKELATSIQSKELAEFQEEFTDQTLAMAAAAQGPGAAALQALATETEELDKQLKNGLITMEQYTARINAMQTPAEEMLASLAFETELLGKTTEEQELLNAARLLGAEAATEQGRAAIQALKDYQEEAKAMAEQIELMDGVRDAFGDFFTSIIDGSKSAKEALKDLVSDILAQITKLMVNKAIEQLFGAYGSAAGGSAGGGWGAALASLFGGQRAAGGPVGPGRFYQVNENGPEVLSVGGRDYLMMGSQGGMVTDTNNRSGGAITQNFNTLGLESRRTTERKAQLAGRSAQRALARNGR